MEKKKEKKLLKTAKNDKFIQTGKVVVDTPPYTAGSGWTKGVLGAENRCFA